MARSKKIKESLEPKETKELKEEKEVKQKVKEYKDSDLLKCKINIAFTDKYTDKLYEVGKEYEFTYKRIKEIKKKNEKYIEIIGD